MQGEQGRVSAEFAVQLRRAIADAAGWKWYTPVDIVKTYECAWDATHQRRRLESDMPLSMEDLRHACFQAGVQSLQIAWDRTEHSACATVAMHGSDSLVQATRTAYESHVAVALALVAAVEEKGGE